MYRMLLIIALLIPMAGCSLKNNGPGTGTPPDWDKLAPTIQSRVRYVAIFAFSMEKVKPYKADVCKVAKDISELLNTYDDKDASFDSVRKAVDEIIAKIENPGARQAVTIFVDIVLTEAFNYAWRHYDNLLNQDEVRTVILIAKAVGDGLSEACDQTASVMSADDGQYAANIFTVPTKR